MREKTLFILSLFCLFSSTTLFSQQKIKVANFDVFSWQEKPCTSGTDKTNYLSFDNENIRIISNKYPSLKHFELKEIEHNDKYRVISAIYTKPIDQLFLGKCWIRDTIIQTSKQLIMFRCKKYEEKNNYITKVRWLTQLDSTHWKLEEKIYEHKLLFKNFLLAFEQNQLNAYLDAIKESLKSLNGDQYNMALFEFNKAPNLFAIKVNNDITKEEFNSTFPVSKRNISVEWLLLNSFLQNGFPSYPGYFPFGD